MHWFMLALGIVFEICGTVCLKLSDGFSNIAPSVLIFVFYGLSFAAAAIAVKHLELGFVYAVWAGLGIMLITVIGMLFFDESVTLIKIASILLIVAGVIGLNLNGVAHE